MTTSYQTVNDKKVANITYSYLGAALHLGFDES